MFAVCAFLKTKSFWNSNTPGTIRIKEDIWTEYCLLQNHLQKLYQHYHQGSRLANSHDYYLIVITYKPYHTLTELVLATMNNVNDDISSCKYPHLNRSLDSNSELFYRRQQINQSSLMNRIYQKEYLFIWYFFKIL